MLEFEAFVAGNYEFVRRGVTLAIGDAARAEDVVQEAFARAFSRWATVRVMERPAAWVYVVAMNRARREWRRERRRTERQPARLPDAAISDVASAVATSVSLKTALAELPPRQRAAVVLRYYADMSNAEVAEAMGCAEGTVKSTLHAALSHLRIQVTEDQL